MAHSILLIIFYGISFLELKQGTLWNMWWQQNPFHPTVVWVAAHLNPGPPTIASHATRPPPYALQWRHYERDGVSNHQPHDCLLNHLFRRRSNKILKLRVAGLCAGNSPVIGEFPAQSASDAENVSIGWRHHENQVRWHTRWDADDLSTSDSREGREVAFSFDYE